MSKKQPKTKEPKKQSKNDLKIEAYVLLGKLYINLTIDTEVVSSTSIDLKDLKP
jgi:hypothetical protein